METNGEVDSLARSMGIVTILLDGDLLVRMASPGAETLFDFPGSPLPLPLQALRYRGGDDSLLDAVRSAAAVGAAPDRPVTTPEERPFLRRAVRVGGGDDRSVLLTFLELTPLIQAGASLRAANQLLEGRMRERTQEMEETHRHLRFSDASVNHASVATFWVGADGIIRRVNQATCRMLGYTEAELLGMHKFDLRVDMHPSRWAPHWEILRTTRHSHFESCFRHKEGREFPVEVESNFVEFDGHEYIFFFVRDITERKRVEESLHRLNDELEARVQERTAALELANAQLRESGEMFRSLVEGAPQAILMVDEAGLISLVNSQTEQLFGYDRVELVGRGIDLLLPERYRAHHPRLRQGFLSAPTARPMGAGRDLYALCKDGSEVPVEIGLSPLRINGRAYVLSTIIDIRARKQAEDRIAASLREKETLLKEIHHRVKNNMQLISSLLQLQSDYIKNPEARGIFREGQNRVRSMALIHEKLYRANTLSSIDFGEYIRTLVDILVPTYAPRPECVEIDVTAELVPLGVDTAVPLALIVNELISNSLKHAFPEGRNGRIVVTLAPGIADGEVALRVADDGVGLPAGLDWRTCPSLGLHLVKILTGQLEGRMEVRARAPGLEFQLSFRELKRRRSH
ncbi:MAG TPA: hypothetical protein DCM86_20085 [Verrucomicrobiales bacterium]|nr:hypothetical protein [Verrucomicrobiales bacterium]